MNQRAHPSALNIDDPLEILSDPETARETIRLREKLPLGVEGRRETDRPKLHRSFFKVGSKEASDV